MMKEKAANTCGPIGVKKNTIRMKTGRNCRLRLRGTQAPSNTLKDVVAVRRRCWKAFVLKGRAVEAARTIGRAVEAARTADKETQICLMFVVS